MITKEKNEELASRLEQLKNYLHDLDIDYVNEIADALDAKAKNKEIIRERTNSTESDLLRKEAQSLRYLTFLTDSFQKCEELKIKMFLEQRKLRMVVLNQTI